MANEIRISASLNVTNGNFSFQHLVNASVDQATAGGGNPGTVDIGTSEEDIDFGDITTEGYAVIQNLDATNYVQFGPKSGGSMVACGRLKAGEVAILRLEPAVIIRAVANTAACKVFVAVIED